jgi:conjugative relaxase-like TrwC/TraI family protein
VLAPRGRGEAAVSALAASLGWAAPSDCGGWSEVLNIGKVIRGKEDYCLDRVARSQEEYYTGAGEAPGYWLGRAAEPLGVAGRVSEAGLHRMLNAAHPDTAERLGAPPRRVRVLAYDLTFRAPKSVSLLYGLGSQGTAAQVRAAHEAAIVQALGYLQRHAALVTRGRARECLEPASGILAAAFQHRTSRAGDPLLHTHVLVANLGQGRDGRWTALDGRALYRHAKTAGYLYQAVLRLELTWRLGVRWGRVQRGSADLDGIPRGTVEAFSQRRQQILSRLVEVGHHSARAAQAATLSTRPVKERGITQGTLRDRWRHRAATLGLTSRQITGLLGQSQPQPLTDTAVDALRARLASADGLTRHRSTSTRRDVIQAICDQLPDGANALEVEAVADQFLTDHDIVCPLAPDGAVALSDHPVRCPPLGHSDAADHGHDRVVQVLLGAFIRPDHGSDVFVHISALQAGGLQTLQEGEAVEFDIEQGRKGPQTANVRPRQARASG